MEDETTDVKRETQVVARQLSLLKDTSQQTLQTRFERFCLEAADALTVTDSDGNPVHDAAKAKAVMQITVEVSRVADDALLFNFSNEIRQKMPSVPGLATSSQLVHGIGLVERVRHDTPSLFDPAGGQPQPMTKEQAEETID